MRAPRRPPPSIIGGSLLFAGVLLSAGCTVQAGDTCENADTASEAEQCAGTKVLECVNGEWLENGACTCTLGAISCMTPGYTGVTRARG